ncbi:MAG: hypothetical protein ACOH2E_02730 [Candidatus Paracaedibacter sp.]
MKLKLFTIGLLATIAMTSTTVEAAQRQRAQAQAAQELPQVKAEIGAAAANLDIGHGGAHVDDPAAAINDLHTKLGTHAGHAAGDKTNHRLDALHTALGHKAVGGGANDPANKKVADAVALIQPGQPLHTGIANTNTRLGVGYQEAADAAAAIAAATGGAVAAGAAPGALEAGLNTLGAKAAGAAHAGHAVPNDSTDKATNLLARLNAGANVVGDGNNHAIVHKGNYPSIEAWITAQGW